jgi:hypothetical protein
VPPVALKSNSRGFGMSVALPCGAPASTHFAIVEISSVGQRGIVLELLDADSRIEKPWRHLVGGGLDLHRACPGPDVLIRHERHRCNTRSSDFWRLVAIVIFRLTAVQTTAYAAGYKRPFYSRATEMLFSDKQVTSYTISTYDPELYCEARKHYGFTRFELIR